MQTYKAEDLDNSQLQQQAEAAFEQGIISKESFTKIKALCGFSLYTPNIFIRIALALLCIVCAVFTGFLFFVMFYADENESVILILLLILSYGLLEYLVKRKHFYNAGIDNTLQVFTILFFSSLFFLNNYPRQDLSVTSAVFLCALWLCIRFADAFMALVAYCTYLVLVFLLCRYVMSSAYIPFVLMGASAFVYLLQHYLKHKHRLRFYDKSFYVLRIASIISFYAACNVYIIDIGNELLNNGMHANSITILWVLDFLIPLAYFFYGFKKQRILFLRSGFLLLVATLVTIYYYQSRASTELVLISGGCILTALSYAGLRYFKKSRHGFTATSVKGLHNDLKNLQILISMQTGSKHSTADNVQFGGGSSGGAGASGNW